MQRPSNSERYAQFCEAVSSANDETLRALCAPGFTAGLPGTGIMTIDGLIVELARQRTAFPDLGKNVRIDHAATENNTIFVSYVMTVTFRAALVGWHGGTIQPTHRPVVIRSVDMLTFDENGLITKLVITSDRLATTEQMMR